MPISVTGSNIRENGFTLIELMVVLVIVALASAAVAVSLQSGTAGLRQEASAFAARAVAARNAAIVSGRPVRVVADAGGYRVEERRAGRWLPWSGKAGRQVAWTNGTSAALEGVVAFDSTGLSDPATLRLARDGKAMAVRVEADGASLSRGEVSLRDDGFTLIEMLVALAVFALAAMALVRLEALTIRTTATVAERTYAQVTLNNLAVTLLTDPRAPTVGKAEGAIPNAGRTWRWAREVTRTDDPNFVRIDLALRDDAGRPVGALSLARPVQ